MKVVQQTPVSAAKGKGIMPPPANRPPFETPRGARVPQTPRQAAGAQTPINRGLFETPVNRHPGRTQEDLGPLETQNRRVWTTQEMGEYASGKGQGQERASSSRLFYVSQGESCEVGRNGSTGGGSAGAPRGAPLEGLRGESLEDSQDQSLNAQEQSYDAHEQSFADHEQSLCCHFPSF